MTQQQIVLATTNQGKVEEFAVLLAELNVTIKTLRDYPEIGEIIENGHSFAENALIKAKTVAAYTGCISVADDSGLEVDGLDGAPGIYSARFAGETRDDEKNISKLLTLLADTPPKQRGAQFCCAIAMVLPEGESFTVEGHCRGFITEEKRGNGGFGYDPVFYVPQFGKTFAQLSMAEKNTISHRGRANQKAIQVLLNILQ